MSSGQVGAVARSVRPGCREDDAATRSGAEDDLLVARVLAGDRAAFAGIVERHHRPVRQLAYRMLDDPDDADDAAQEAFVRAYCNLTKYRPGSSLRTWLLAITSNWCLDQLRRRKTQRRIFVHLETVADSLEALEETPEVRLLHAERSDALRGRVAALPDHYRRILALRYEDELSYDEIGTALGSPVSTVRMRLFRARRHLLRDAGPTFSSAAEGAD